MGCHPSHWLIFFREVETTNQIYIYIYVYVVNPPKTGWWFGTCFIFPNSLDDDPIWLIFFRGVGQPPTSKRSHPFLWPLRTESLWRVPGCASKRWFSQVKQFFEDALHGWSGGLGPQEMVDFFRGRKDGLTWVLASRYGGFPGHVMEIFKPFLGM
jgi:hypothetical protein